MSDKNDGGPAFPRSGNENVLDQDGMSLRDYFASKSVTIAYWHCLEGIKAGKTIDTIEAVPQMAYALADAMLRERARGTK